MLGFKSFVKVASIDSELHCSTDHHQSRSPGVSHWIVNKVEVSEKKFAFKRFSSTVKQGRNLGLSKKETCLRGCVAEWPSGRN